MNTATSSALAELDYIGYSYNIVIIGIYSYNIVIIGIYS